MEVAVLGIDGYEPQWCHDAATLAAAHRARFTRLIGRPLIDVWLMWDLDQDTWYANGPVVLGFGDTNVEVTHRKFDECAITWNQVDMTMPVDQPGLRLDWRADRHPAPLPARGRPLRAVNVIERIMPSHWRPHVLHAVEFRFDGARLAVHNALDENGLSAAPDVDLPIVAWRRRPVA